MQAGLLFNLLSYITDTHLPLNNHSQAEAVCFKTYFCRLSLNTELM